MGLVELGEEREVLIMCLVTFLLKFTFKFFGYNCKSLGMVDHITKAEILLNNITVYQNEF